MGQKCAEYDVARHKRLKEEQASEKFFDKSAEHRVCPGNEKGKCGARIWKDRGCNKVARKLVSQVVATPC